jgi:uncharacterized membrane protein
MKNEIKTDDKIIASISYLWILFLIPMLLKKDNAYCNWHARQGLVVFLMSIVLMIFGPVGAAVSGVVSLFGFYFALKGEEWKIPYLHKLAEKIKI